MTTYVIEVHQGEGQADVIVVILGLEVPRLDNSLLEKTVYELMAKTCNIV